MRLIDEQCLKMPFYGWPRMTAYLQAKGYAINHNLPSILPEAPFGQVISFRGLDNGGQV